MPIKTKFEFKRRFEIDAHRRILDLCLEIEHPSIIFISQQVFRITSENLLQESGTIGFGDGVVVKDLVVKSSSGIELCRRCGRLGGGKPRGSWQEKQK